MTIELTGREGRPEMVAGALKRAASRVKARGPEAWELSLGNGFRLAGTARLEGPWLSLEAPLRSRRRMPGAWDLLSANASLEGGARFALSGGPGSVSLRADLPLAPTSGLEPRLRSCLRGLHQGVSFWKGGSRPAPAPVGEGLPSPGEAGAGADPGLEALCEEAGWDSREQSGGGRRVDLDAERGVYHAELRSRVEGGVSAVAELVRLSPLEPVARLAVAVLLLTAGRAVRLARPGALESEEGAVALAEVSLPPPLRAAEVDRALGALSTFGWLVGPEIVALGEPALAGAYLESRGWSPRLD